MSAMFLYQTLFIGNLGSSDKKNRAGENRHRQIRRVTLKGANKRGKSQIGIKAGKPERRPSPAQQDSENPGKKCG
jgi:hypothetical protein